MSKVPLNKLEMLALSVTRGVGSVTSVIIHTFMFTGAFALVFFGFDFDRVLLVLTTIVSLEAIYLSIFIQMSVNKNTQSIASVEKDIDEIQENIDEIQEDVEEIAEDVEHIEEHVEDIQENIDDIQENVDDPLAEKNSHQP